MEGTLGFIAEKSPQPKNVFIEKGGGIKEKRKYFLTLPYFSHRG